MRYFIKKNVLLFSEEHIKSFLLPCLIFSALTGILSAIAVTAFKLAAQGVIHVSESIYSFVRTDPKFLPLLILAAAGIGIISSLILSISHTCRGGGIPSSVAAIRGLTSFKWLASIFVLPFSALLTFLCGIPLGTEGPCVQMGTAIGDGVIRCFGKEKHLGWRRYIMTGGGSAGFSLAASSPITAIIFSTEELSKHFSPMLLTVASLSVAFAQITSQILSFFGIESTSLFHIGNIPTLDLKYLAAPLIIGLICGISSIIFTKLYHLIDKLMRTVLGKLSSKVVFPVIFASVALVGFFLSDTLGNGHSLTDKLLYSNAAWYLLIIVFLIRAAAMMLSNTAGTTGGIFLPTLAFGAIIGSLSAKAMISLGIISEEFYILSVVLGIASFLGATSHIPITACIFAIEALGCTSNVLSVIISTTVALLTVELSGLEDFTDTVINATISRIHKGKTPSVIEVSLTVKKTSFVIGKERRDILWPNSCTLVSFERAQKNKGNTEISEGDIITLHYKTYDPAATAREIEILVGNQSDEVRAVMIPEL